MEAIIESDAGDAGDVVLRDGSTAHLRPGRSDDRAALLEFYGHLSPESRYFRFFGKPRVGDIVDDVVRAIHSGGAFTLVAEIDRHIVAIGQYFPYAETPELAEVAFAVADAYQGHGIATALLHRLGAVARTRGITSFEAYMLHDNHKMREVFVDAGFGVEWKRIDSQTAKVRLSLSDRTLTTPGRTNSTIARLNARQAASAARGFARRRASCTQVPPRDDRDVPGPRRSA